MSLNPATKGNDMSNDKYRVESGKVFEYSEDHEAYLFHGALNGRCLREYLEDQERADYAAQLAEDAEQAGY